MSGTWESEMGVCCVVLCRYYGGCYHRNGRWVDEKFLHITNDIPKYYSYFSS